MVGRYHHRVLGCWLLEKIHRSFRASQQREEIPESFRIETESPRVIICCEHTYPPPTLAVMYHTSAESISWRGASGTMDSGPHERRYLPQGNLDSFPRFVTDQSH
eukprot:scaffold249339_cov49-Cyclotella_meneghiniana.AAC.3